MSKKKNASSGKWTPRSKPTVLQQEELERQREELQSRIAHQKKEVADLQKDREAYAKQTLTDKSPLFRTLDRCLADLRAAEEKLDVWYDQLDRVEKQIESCEPTAEEAAEREKNQNALASLAEERLATDQQIHKQLGQLSSLLQKRREVSSSMAEKAQALKMEGKLDLDQDRFDALLNSLPTNVLAPSQVWLDWFFGRQSGEVRAVPRERVERRETLAHTGIYNLGDVFELSQAEFDQLRRTDLPANDPYAPWKCQPARVFSIEEYESARAEAEKKGVLLEEVVILQDLRRFQKNKELYEGQKGRVTA